MAKFFYGLLFSVCFSINDARTFPRDFPAISVRSNRAFYLMTQLNNYTASDVIEITGSRLMGGAIISRNLSSRNSSPSIPSYERTKVVYRVLSPIVDIKKESSKKGQQVG